LLIDKPAHLILISSISLCFTVSASGQPLSNEQVVISSVKDAAANGLSGDSENSLRIVSDEEGLQGIFATGIAEGIIGKYARVMIMPTEDSSAFNLNFDILGFNFTYEKGSSRGFLKTKKIRRALNCELRIIVKSGADGALREIKRLPIDYHDEVEPSSIKVINSRIIPELAPVAPGSGWSRFMEPSLVIATVGALVYLFFANR